ncbi:DksA-like zinc finger domain containing protein [Microcystis phage Mwe-Yong1]|nr:DksA-like zinc finger domain containing protein [Microcystis phage Mwe-Yong1]
MTSSNFAIELAERRIEEERDAGVARARAALRGPGAPSCVVCGDQIPAARRQALPATDRCVHCAERRERRR